MLFYAILRYKNKIDFAISFYSISTLQPHTNKSNQIQTEFLNMTFVHTIPFVGSHSSIVIGKRGSTIKQLQTEFGCFIKAMKPDKEKGLPLPYFLIEGNDERAVNHVIIKIQGLLLRSMCRTERGFVSTIKEMSSTVQHLTLVVADKEDQLSKKVPFPPNSISSDINSYLSMQNKKTTSEERDEESDEESDDEDGITVTGN